MAQYKRTGANHARRKQERHQVIRSKTAGAGRRLIKMSGVLSLVILGGGALVAAVVNAPKLTGMLPSAKVGQITVKESQHMKKQEVLTAAGVTAGMQLSDVNPARIADAVRKNPWIEKVIVNRQFPGTVSITLQERVPVALVTLGTVFQIDRAGVLLDLPAGVMPDLPVVTGVSDTVFNGVRRIHDRDMSRFNSLCDITAQVDPALRNRIAQVDLTGGSAIRMLLSGTPAVVTVNDLDLKTQISNLKQILGTIGQDNAAGVKGINLCYQNLAFVEQADSTIYE